MCYNCRGRGHYARDCTVKLCSLCHGKGHEESGCPFPANMESVLAIEMSDPGDGAIAAALFVATEVDGSGDAVYGHLQGGPLPCGTWRVCWCGSIGGKEGLALALRVGEERKSLEAWCFDSGSFGNMTHSCEKITDFRVTISCVPVMASIIRLKVTAMLLLSFNLWPEFGTPEAFRHCLITERKLPPVLRPRLRQTRPHLPS